MVSFSPKNMVLDWTVKVKGVKFPADYVARNRKRLVQHTFRVSCVSGVEGIWVWQRLEA